MTHDEYVKFRFDLAHITSEIHILSHDLSSFNYVRCLHKLSDDMTIGEARELLDSKIGAQEEQLRKLLDVTGEAYINKQEDNV